MIKLRIELRDFVMILEQLSKADGSGGACAVPKLPEMMSQFFFSRMES
jgi:hypothetical protein